MEIEHTSRYIPSLNSHRVERSLALQTIPIFVIGPPDLAPEIVYSRAQNGIEFVAAQFSNLLTYLADELLEIKNSSWLKEAESQLSAEQFRRNLTPHRITVLEDGAIDVGFVDCGMFWGHEVVLRTDASLKPIAADIEG